MNALNAPTSFFWRATSAVLRRTGSLLTRVANDAYTRSLPKLSTEERRLIRANERFRNCHAGQRCFVIGNGPSIAKQDLSRLVNEITFVANAFWRHPIVEKWQPSYYFLADPVFFDRSISAREFFDALRTRVHETTFFVPLHHEIVVEEEGLLPLASTRFFALKRRLLGEDSQDSVDLTRMLPSAEIIAQLAIMSAIYMGCSPIYLIGQDHDWLAHHGERGYNFYKGLTLTNHPLASGTLGDYDLEMASLVKVWKTYRRLRTIAENRRIDILNATEGGFLDVFERVSYESLFNREKGSISKATVHK